MVQSFVGDEEDLEVDVLPHGESVKVTERASGRVTE